ncbi:MAG: HAMP domain-containing sensor histidine kinase [Acetobacterales bacterium]
MAVDAPRNSPIFGLSARLLVLTVVFVMIAEVLIYAPSVARFRYTFLQDRLAAGHLATLALEATPDNMVSPELKAELLRHSMAYLVRLRKPGRSVLMLGTEDVPDADLAVDLTERGFFGLIVDAFGTLLRTDDRILRVMGHSPRYPEIDVEVVIDEEPMRLAMWDFSQRILALSLLISFITASMVYLSLHWLLVRPMRRITASITAFRQAPEDASSVIGDSRRRDEIGIALRELAIMQADLRAALWQKTRLAALGQAVTRINHDLRSILSTALVLSDRLETSEDPEVRRVTPPLVRSIDRAVDLCGQTLRYAREGPPPLSFSRFPLSEVVTEAGTAVREGGHDSFRVDCRLLERQTVLADREKLFRVLFNLLRNAAEAGARNAVAEAGVAPGRIEITLSDDGPGVPAMVRETLFTPFAGSGKQGSAGLGLVIARELMRAHGGDVELVSTGKEGTVFRLHLRDTASS